MARLPMIAIKKKEEEKSRKTHLHCAFKTDEDNEERVEKKIKTRYYIKGGRFLYVIACRK